MSKRRDKRRAELAARASADFDELMALMEERAWLRIVGPKIAAELSRGGCGFAGEVHGSFPAEWATWLAEGSAPPGFVAEFDRWRAGRDAELAEEIRGYHGDDRVAALVEAHLAIEAGRTPPG